jgi:glycosyltransferase involved in cell wall biosynthesis
MARTKIAIVHPRLGFGGSESVALWAVEALKDRAEVSLITGGKVDLARLNEYYGTDIRPDEISILRAPMPWGLRGTTKFSGLRWRFTDRFCKRIAPEFDLVINTYGPCDFGVPAVQCIADFSFVEEWRNRLNPALENHRRWWYGDSPVRKAYLGLCNLISAPASEAWKGNLTLANSHWTAALLKEQFGIESRVVYPPVAGSFPPVEWGERENGFVCVGRVVPEKRMDAVVRILDKVRQAGHDVHLHILGGLDDSTLGVTLLRMAVQRGWIRLEGRTFGQRKIDLMAGHRFGINARENEPFGIAPAELVKAGAITFVPASGGQAEIVNHPMLTFENEDAAAQKICTVLSSAALQENLRQHLAKQARKFSAESFEAGIREVVFHLLDRNWKKPASSVTG